MFKYIWKPSIFFYLYCYHAAVGSYHLATVLCPSIVYYYKFMTKQVKKWFELII